MELDLLITELDETTIQLRMQQLKRQLARWQNTILNFRQEILKNLLQKLWWMML